MAAGDVHRLWKLHLVDQAILEIRSRAAGLDPGRRIQGQIDTLQKSLEVKDGKARALSAELTDLELKQKQIEDKIKRIDKDLYGGSVVNPREVENFQKEIQILKRQRGESDVRVLELWELIPPAKAESAKVQEEIATAAARLQLREL